MIEEIKKLIALAERIGGGTKKRRDFQITKAYEQALFIVGDAGDVANRRERFQYLWGRIDGFEDTYSAVGELLTFAQTLLRTAENQEEK
jgi:hypothetical protein